MFGPLVRAGGVLLVGAILYVPITMAGDEMIALLVDEGPAESSNLEYFEILVEWYPAIILASVVVILIAGAVARRRRAVIS